MERFFEEGMDGFNHGRKLEKLGLHGQDTAELFFDDVLAEAIAALPAVFLRIADSEPATRVDLVE